MKKCIQALSIAILSVSVFINGSSSAAAKDSECTAALISTNIVLNSETARHLSILNIVDESNYSRKTSEIASSISALLKGVPVVGNLDYKKFGETRREIFQKYSYDESYENSVSYLHQSLPKTVTDAFVECLRIKSNSENGFHAYISAIRENYATLTIRWNNSNDNDSTDVELVFLDGTETPEEKIPSTLNANKTKNIGLKRNQQIPIFVSIAGGGQTAADLTVAKEPEISLPCGARSNLDTVQLNEFTGRLTQACNACGSCEGPYLYHINSKTNIDLACVAGFQSNTDTALGDSYDCSWNGGTYPVNTLSFQNGTTMNIVDSCKTIASLASSRGEDVPANFCN